MKKIAVLLTVHNRKQKTLACLKGLYDQKIPDQYSIDTYMTDDGCTDGTPEAVIAEFPQVNIIKGDGNLFWNRGMYLAWEKAYSIYDYDFYFWLNDDTILLSNALKEMIEEAEGHSDSVIIGSCHSSTDPDKLTYGGHGLGNVIVPNGELQLCQTFNGNIVLITKHIFKLIGNLDWTYHHAIGDLDYGLMVTKSGNCNYVSKYYRGICDRNTCLPKWTRSDIPFKERWKNFHSPLAYGEPKAMFHFNRKNFGLVKAVRVFTTNYIRVLCPILKKGK